jgi:hypothetical protein
MNQSKVEKLFALSLFLKASSIPGTMSTTRTVAHGSPCGQGMASEYSHPVQSGQHSASTGHTYVTTQN